MCGFRSLVALAGLLLLGGCWDFDQLKRPLPGDDMAMVIDDLGTAADLAGADIPLDDLVGVVFDLRANDLAGCANPMLTGPIRYVNLNAAAGGDGLTPTTALQQIKDAIESLSATGGNVLIANGAYHESLALPTGRMGINLWGGYDAGFTCRVNSVWPPATQVIADAGKAAVLAQSNLGLFNLQVIGTNGDGGVGGVRTVALATDGGGGITVSLTQVLVVARPDGGATPIALGIDARNTRLALTDSVIDVSNGEVSTGVQACGTWVTGQRATITVDGSTGLARGIFSTVTPPVGNCVFPTGNISDRHVDLVVSIVNVRGGNAYGVRLDLATPGFVQLSSSGVVSRASGESYGVAMLNGSHRLAALSSTVTTQRDSSNSAPVLSSGSLTFEPRDSIFDGNVALDLTVAPTVNIFDVKVKNLYYTTRSYLPDMGGTISADLATSAQTVGMLINGAAVSLDSYRATYDSSAMIGQDPQFTAEPPGVTSTSPARNAAVTGAQGAGCNGVLFSYNRMNRPTQDCDIGAFEQ